MRGDVEVMKMLLDKGANLDAADKVSLSRPCPLSSATTIYLLPHIHIVAHIYTYMHTCMYECAAMIHELASIIGWCDIIQ